MRVSSHRVAASVELARAWRLLCASLFSLSTERCCCLADVYWGNSASNGCFSVFITTSMGGAAVKDVPKRTPTSAAEDADAPFPSRCGVREPKTGNTVASAAAPHLPPGTSDAVEVEVWEAVRSKLVRRFRSNAQHTHTWKCMISSSLAQDSCAAMPAASKEVAT